MENNRQFDWEKILRRIGIMRLKFRRSLHRFNQKYKLSQTARRFALLAAIKTIAAFAPGSAPLAQNGGASQGQGGPNKEMLTLAKAANVDATVIWEKLNAYIAERQKDFAMDLSADLSENIQALRDGKKRGKKTATLRNLFGKVDSRYYCAIGGLKTIEGLSKKAGYTEYDFLLKCIENPHSCLSVIKGLSDYYGDNCRTTNIRKTLNAQRDADPNSVFIVLLNTAENSSSGKHFVIVTPEFAADSIVTAKGDAKLTVYGFNSEVIAKPESYFSGSRNRGYVFNLTEMGRDKLIELFYSGRLPLKEKGREKELVHFQPVGQLSQPDISRYHNIQSHSR